MADFALTILTPAGKAYEGRAEAIVAPGVLGSLGVLAHHAPMVTGLSSGVVKITDQNGAKFFTVDSGVLEIDKGNKVVVLVEQALASANQEEASSKLAELVSKG